jgi:hypothetical protein
MWTNEELITIRDRAELEADSTTQNLIWRHACLDLAAAVDRLLMFHQRVTTEGLTALINENGTVKRIKPQCPIGG